MRGTEHFLRHLSVRTELDGVKVSEQPIEDPFITHRLTIGFSFWDLLRMMFTGKREYNVRVKIQSDGVSQGRWFRGADICENCKQAPIGIGHGLRYIRGNEQWCLDCQMGTKPKSVANSCDGSNGP